MDQRHIGRLLILQLPTGSLFVSRERAEHALFAEITRNRAFQVPDTDARLPPACGKLRFGVPLDEDAGLDALDGTRVSRKRTEHECERIDKQAERHGIDERIGARPAEHLCSGKNEAQNACRDIGVIGATKARQKEKIGPDEEAGAEAGDRAARIGPPP